MPTQHQSIVSRDSSPFPLSDDSAVGSMSSCLTNGDHNCSGHLKRPHQATNGLHQPDNSQNVQSQPVEYQISRPKITRPSAKDLKVNSDDLEQAAKHMRSNNVGLISRSVRTVLSCFDDLDTQRFESRTNYLINFISNGIYKCSTSILRPVSILWPESYEKMVEKLAILDAYLINTEFREKPVDWMLKRGLTTVPNCRQCKEKMTLNYENNIVRWQCLKSQACANYIMPVQRPSFFSSYENVGLDKLLFAIYYWSTCTPAEELYPLMNLDHQILDGIWRRMQNVCRTALEKSYPRHRLTNVVDQGPFASSSPEPIDLVSIKVNDVYVVCAKHPRSNLVRLGLYIPTVSRYSFVELTESWFAHGAQIRVSESKFLDLSKKRTDLRILVVPRLSMIAKDGQFYRESAFGYIICQLTHVLKDFDSTSLTRESLKLILAEMQWRELYGTNPFDAFTNIVHHMAQFGEASDWYSEPSVPAKNNESVNDQVETESQTAEENDYVWAESHFYATVNPVDSTGKVICRFAESPDLEHPPQSDVRIRCHECNDQFECFDFSIHMIGHVEGNRRENERKEYLKRNLIECKHCFKTYKRDALQNHCALFRSHLHQIKFGCRICCVTLDNRSDYLQHMRRLHFYHETPYKCPTCPFASSFQRDVFIHFQEEHRHSMIALCPLCLRSFTVKKPDTMNRQRMGIYSQAIYNHLAEHYITSKGFACSNCCLCFLDKDSLIAHKNRSHDPLEIKSHDKVKVESFIVTPSEEKYCVKALPMELFIANKQPNLPLDSAERLALAGMEQPGRSKSNGKEGSSSSDSSGSDSDVNGNQSDSSDEVIKKKTKSTTTGRRIGVLDSNSSSSESPIDDDDDSLDRCDEGTIHVRGLSEAKKFLQGGRPALKVAKTRISKSIATGGAKVDDNRPSELTSQRLIDLLSKMKRADGVIPNQSVILTPIGTPAKCCECFHYVTVDHYVAKIFCKSCDYRTHCPRAATNHKITEHPSS